MTGQLYFDLINDGLNGPKTIVVNSTNVKNYLRYTENKYDTYLKKIVELLKKYNVDLLVFSSANMNDDEFTDKLLENNIYLLHIPSNLIEAATSICKNSIDDILNIDRQNPPSFMSVYLSPASSIDYSEAQSNVACKLCMVEPLESECTNDILLDIPVFIGISGTCRLLVDARLDQFKRCFSRLVSVVKNEGVVPGGGIIELLVAMHFEHLISKKNH